MFEVCNTMGQLLLANLDDCYYLDSLVKLNLQQYIYVQLKKTGYENIYFFDNKNCSRKEFHMIMPDAESADAYDKVSRGIFAQIFGLSSAKNEKGKKILFHTSDEFSDICYKLLENNKKTVFVVPVELLELLFETSEQVREFTDFAKKNNYASRNLLLTYISVEHEGSMVFFKNPNGILRSGLYPEIEKFFDNSEKRLTAETKVNWLSQKQERNPRFYEHLNEVMGNKIHFLNQLEVSQIEAMLVSQMLQKTPKLDIYAENISNFAKIIYNWQHSKQFRLKTEQILGHPLFLQNVHTRRGLLKEFERQISENRLHEMTELIEEICCEGRINLDNALQSYQNDFEQQLVVQTDNDNWIQYLNEIEQGDCVNENERKKIHEMKTAIQCTHLYSVHPLIHQELESFIKEVLWASQEGNRLSVQKGIKSINYGIGQLYFNVIDGDEINKDDDRMKCWNMCVHMLEATHKYEEINKNYQEIEQQLQQARRDYQESKKKVMEFQEQHPATLVFQDDIWKKDGQLDGDVHILAELKKDAVYRKNSIKNLKYNLGRLEGVRSELNSAISKFEQTIDELNGENLFDIAQKLESAAEIMTRRLSSDIELATKMTQVSLAYDDVLAEAKVLSKIGLQETMLDAEELEEALEELEEEDLTNQ